MKTVVAFGIRVFCMMLSMLWLTTGTALAGSNFSAFVGPEVMEFAVSPRGAITGERYAGVNIHRLKVGKGRFCAKIRWLDVVRGSDYQSPSMGSLRLDPTRCFFKKIVQVRPFSDSEIRNVCQNSAGTVQYLDLAATAFAWKKPATYEATLQDLKRYNRPKASAPVRFRARVKCGARAASPSPAPSRGSAGSGFCSGVRGNMRCDLAGTWKAVYADGSGSSVRYRFDRIFTYKGNKVYRATVLRGRRSDEVGTLTQTTEGNYLFHWIDNFGVPSGRGRYKHTYLMVLNQGRDCNRMDEVVNISSKGKMKRSYYLERISVRSGSGGIGRGGLSPVGKPKAPGGSIIPQQKKPRTPGGGFTPGPNLPAPTPRW